MLTTVPFTDIVGSMESIEQAATALGMSCVNSTPPRSARYSLATGKLSRTTGDGFFATFHGPRAPSDVLRFSLNDERAAATATARIPE